MFCPNCGHANDQGAHFCGGCGTTLPAAGAPTAAGPPAAPPTGALPQIPPVPAAPPMPPVPPMGADPTLVGGPPMPPMPPGPPDATAAFAVPPPGGPPPGAAPAGGGKSKGLIFGGIALLVVLALVAGFVFLGGDDGDGDEEGAGSGDGASELVAIELEPIGATRPDDFAGNLDLDEFSSSIAIALPDVPPLGAGIASALSARRAEGDTPGLYGGSRDAAVCDVDTLVDFLTDEDNADKAAAWADVQGIEVDEIEDFIRGLTPVRLRFDTRVTNHGFDEDDGATPIQSILEAGTAVLVDADGVPRAKCNCGNPLAEPADVGDLDDDEALDDGLIDNPEDAWDLFDPELVVVVEPAQVSIDVFVLVSIDEGDLFTRPTGTNGDEDDDVDIDEFCDGDLADSPTCGDDGEETTTTEFGEETTTTVALGTGDVQVTLRWPSDADLDLVVIDPNGEEASRSSSTSTGGQLDVDSNVGCDNDGSVENVFWPEGAAPLGEYTVIVEGFSVDGCGGGDYDITVLTTGQAPQTFSGSVLEDGTSSHTFFVG